MALLRINGALREYLTDKNDYLCRRNQIAIL